MNHNLNANIIINRIKTAASDMESSADLCDQCGSDVTANNIRDVARNIYDSVTLDSSSKDFDRELSDLDNYIYDMDRNGFDVTSRKLMDYYYILQSSIRELDTLQPSFHTGRNFFPVR